MKTLSPKDAFLIDLDREVITLPGRSLESIFGIFAHLESLSCRREKGGEALNGVNMALAPALLPASEICGAPRITFRELGRQVIRATQSQVRVLQNRAEEMQSLVLINPWGVAHRLWTEFLPDCKTPLHELNFLEELWGIRSDKLEVDGWSLVRH